MVAAASAITPKLGILLIIFRHHSSLTECFDAHEKL
jgi:hypothetical protein